MDEIQSQREKIVASDISLSSSAAGAVNLFTCLVQDMGLSYRLVPLGKHTPGAPLEEDEAYTIEQMMHRSVLVPALAHLAEELSIISTGQRLFSFDYVMSDEAALGITIQDNGETEAKMNGSDFRRVPNSLMYNFAQTAMYRMLQPQADNTLKVLYQLPRFSPPVIDEELQQLVSRFPNPQFLVNGDFDRITRFEMGNKELIRLREQGQAFRQAVLERAPHPEINTPGEKEVPVEPDEHR